jgi:hypothetical protein
MSVSANPMSAKLRSRALRAALLSVGLVAASAGSASAQGFARTFFEDDVLPPRVIAWRLADRGFTGVTRPRYDGRFYLVDAISPAGMPVRVVVDPTSGAIVGRERMPGQEVYARLERPPVRSMPGYGWTEDDVARPPQPAPYEPGPSARQQRRPGAEAARPPEGNALGLNPDGGHRAEPPRKVARTSPTKVPEKPSLAKVSPVAPAPKPVPEAAQPPAEPATPAANANTPAEPKPVAAAAAPKPDWKDPPAEGKRNVRVIGGATVVPGTPGKDGEASQ